MSSDADAVQARIVRLESDLAGQAEGTAEHRASRVALAAALAARYVQHGGADEDRVRAEQIARGVLADPAATPEQRQAMSMLLPTLTMLAVTPAAALRGHGPGLDLEALRLTEQWQRSTDPGTMLAGMGQLLGQLDAIEDVDSLPPQIRSSLAMVRAAMGLLADTQRPGWDGQVAPEVTARLRSAVQDAPLDVPGVALMRGLTTWVEGFDAQGERGARVAELDAAIARLADDRVLAPLLRQERAKALLGGADLGGGLATVREATESLQQALDAMAPDHPSYGETVRMLAGGLVAVAAEEPSEQRRAAAERAVREALRHSPGDGRVERGERLFLESLLGLLTSITHGGREAEAPLRQLVACIELLPLDHALRAVAVGQLGAVLADRALMAGLRAESDTAVDLLDRAARAAGSDPASGALIVCVAGIARVNRAIRRGEPGELTAAATELRTALADLASGHPMRPNITLVLTIADLRSAIGSGGDVRSAIATVRDAAAGGGLVGIAPSVADVMVDAVDSIAGLLDADPDAVAGSIARMEAALVSTDSGLPYQRAGQHALLGKAYLATLGHDRPDRDAAERAVEHLQAARRLLDYRAGAPLDDVLRDLAVAHRAHGDRDPSRRVAFEALEVRAGGVLLQSEVGDAVGVAQGASADAIRLARWCLADGDLGGAVEAVELGRGLVLHAATSVVAVPTSLAEVGRDDLAGRWREAQDRTDPAPWAVPAARGAVEPSEIDLLRAVDDLRHEVLEVLQGTPEGLRLFRAPSPRAIGQAVSAVGADVLAYLLPGRGNDGGQLLLVDRAGRVTARDLPELRDDADGPLDAYLAARRPGRVGYTGSWRAALARLCDWAGTALLEPLLAALRERPPDDRPAGGPAPVPRVVLVPGGRLGAVPWPAARRATGPTGVRHACQDLVVSTAASARQLIDVAARDPLPLDGRPVLVGNPTGDMPGARAEVLALRAGCYPDAILLGDLGEGGPAADGRGTPADLLAHLPGRGVTGSPLVHLGCHAVATDRPDQSYIALTTPLSIRELLGRARNRAVAAGGPLVVGSACESDFTLRDYDEALTLATAFLAGGAVAVVGSLWAVSDRITPVFMFAFHHFLAVGGQRPADALRAAQLWMLDHDRAALPGMPAELAGRVRLHGLAELETWAAFAHHGR